MLTVKARFDGHVFIPEQPVNLPTDTVVEIPLLPAAGANGPGGVWQVLRAYAGSVEAPEDWSEQLDHYLYGTPKQPTESAP